MILEGMLFMLITGRFQVKTDSTPTEEIHSNTAAPTQLKIPADPRKQLWINSESQTTEFSGTVRGGQIHSHQKEPPDCTAVMTVVPHSA